MVHVTMTDDEWVDKYKPLQNPIYKDAEFNGTMFGTHGPEETWVKEIAKSRPYNVWTLLEDDHDGVIVDGYHYVNRQGYFITAVAYDPDNTVEAYLETFKEEEEEEEEDEGAEEDSHNVTDSMNAILEAMAKAHHEIARRHDADDVRALWASTTTPAVYDDGKEYPRAF